MIVFSNIITKKAKKKNDLVASVHRQDNRFVFGTLHPSCFKDAACLSNFIDSIKYTRVGPTEISTLSEGNK